MSDTFLIQIDHSEGALQRLIGLIERRGFDIARLNVADAGEHRDVRMTVRPRDATRCTEILGRQIDRLIGVRRMPGAASHVQEAVSCPA